MKRCNLIKRFFIGLLLIVVASISANAQEGLYVKSIFQRFGHAKGCKMVTMQNTQLKGYKLKIYLKSATYWVSWDFACKRQKFILLYIFLA